MAYSQGLDAVRLHSFVEVPSKVERPTAFWEVLHFFENQLLWKYFLCDGDGKLIHQGLIMCSLVVCDGSYVQYVAKDVYAAAFMVYCKFMKQRYNGSVVDK